VQRDERTLNILTLNSCYKTKRIPQWRGMVVRCVNIKQIALCI